MALGLLSNGRKMAGDAEADVGEGLTEVLPATLSKVKPYV